jgi:hypothetical protein
MSTTLRSLFCLCVLTASVAAQAGGHTAGDLFLYSPAATGGSATEKGILKIDPTSGATTLMVDLANILQTQGAICYDSYRQRVLFCGAVDFQSPTELSLLDGAGTVTPMGLPGGSYSGMAPTGDGRVYLRRHSDASAPFQYIDAANQLHKLMDAAGTSPFFVPGVFGYPFRGMIYDAGENALFLAVGDGPQWVCSGGDVDSMNVYKLPLSADGTRVTGPVTCNQYDVAVGDDQEKPVGWSRGPGGKLMLVVDTNSNQEMERMLLVDPVTLAITPYAANGYAGAAATNGGTYSSVLGKAVILDTGGDVLRAFAQGETGAGTIFTTPGEVSGGGSNETASLIEIAHGSCDGAFVPYGAGLAGTGGFVPVFSMSGCAIPGGVINVHLDDVVGGASGLMMVGAAPVSLPFKGGTLLTAPLILSVGIGVGGTPGAAGAGTLDLPAGLPAGPLLSGVKLYLQAGFQDTGAPVNVSLSNAVMMEIG